MPTSVLVTALPYSLADDVPFQLTVFVTHKLVGGGALLTDYPAAVDWPSVLAAASLSLTASNGAVLPLRVVSSASSAAWAAVLPPSTPVAPFPSRTLSDATVRTNPASRMSDHAIDLQLAAIAASPARRPALAGDPVAEGLLQTLANLDQRGPLRQLLDDAAERARRAAALPGKRLQDALTTLGPLTDDGDTPWNRRGEIGPVPSYQSEIVDHRSALEVLLDDPDADSRVTAALDALVGQDLSADPQLQMIVDAHAMRRYYERPEQPAQAPRARPDPDAPPAPRPTPPEHDFHAKVASFGSTPALLRRLGLAVDVVVDGMDAAGARAALAGATWVNVDLGSNVDDLEVLPPRRTATTVSDAVFAARSSAAWQGGALPLGEDGWVVLDTDPDASGLKLDMHARNLGRQYASEANGDPATSAPATLRSTGFALARRDRASDVKARVASAEALAADDGTRELLLDDLVRGIRVEVWDDQSTAWHSLHRRRVTVTGKPGGTTILDDEPDVGFLQLSALNRAPGDTTNGYYLHEVVAGWDGWSLSAPRPGLTVVHVEPPGPDGETEQIVETSPDPAVDGAQVVSRVEPKSLPRLRYGTSYSFRVLAVDLAGNSVPQSVPIAAAEAAPEEVAVAEAHLARLRDSYGRRDRAGIAAARRAAVVEHHGRARREQVDVPHELRSGDPAVDATLTTLLARARGDRLAVSAAQRQLDEVSDAARILAAARDTMRVRPQLRTDPRLLAGLARNDDLLLPDGARAPEVPAVTTPRPYLRWEPVPAPAIVARQELGTGEQLAHLVIRSGAPAGPDSRATAERHLAPPKSTQLEAEAAGLFDSAIGTSDEAEIRRLYAVALAERGTLLDQFAPSLTDPSVPELQPGIALADRPGADTDPTKRATLDTITADRGRPLAEGQYVVHDVDALRLPYLPDPYARGISFVFYEAGPPHLLGQPRALQSVTVDYPGDWPSLQPLRLVVEGGAELGARVVDHEVRVTVPPGEQVRVAVSSTIDVTELEKFGLWRSHLASIVDPADGFTPDEVVASAALMRAAASGWTWWLTPSTDVRLVHGVPTPVRAPSLRDLSLFVRRPGRSVVALTGLVDVHGPSTDTLLVRATWTEQVDDPALPAPQTVTKSDVVVRSTVGEQERTGLLFLYDYQPSGVIAQALDGIGLHQTLQTFPDTHFRRVSYVAGGTSRYAEMFPPADVPGPAYDDDALVLDIPSAARPAAPQVLDTVPVLRWEEGTEPGDPFAWRQVRRAGVRVWLARPWFSSGDGELLGVLVFDRFEWVKAGDGSWTRQAKGVIAPDGATSLWGADPILVDGGQIADATALPLLSLEELLVDGFETAVSGPAGIVPPLHGEPAGGHDRGWTHGPGHPVAVAPAVPLNDVQGHPTVRVLGYQPEYDEASGRWFVDVDLQETPVQWPFVRLAVARYQPVSLEGLALSPTALTSWVQPLPSRTLTVSRPDRRRVQVTLSGGASWLRQTPQVTELPGELLSEDSPTGAAAAQAAQLQLNRTVRATVQQRPAGGSDLEWQAVTSTLLVASTVEVGGWHRATWTGTLQLPGDAGTPGGDAEGIPALRRPGGPSATWRVLVEEHELLDADPSDNQLQPGIEPRLVYAGEIAL